MKIEDFMQEFEAGMRAVKFANAYDRADFLSWLLDNGVPIFAGTLRYINNPEADSFEWDYMHFARNGHCVAGLKSGHELAKTAIRYEDLEFPRRTIMSDDDFKVALDQLLGGFGAKTDNYAVKAR